MYVHVRVQPGAKREEFKEVKPEHFVVSVKEKAERNMAKIKVQELLTHHFKLKPSAVRLISGHHSPSKIFAITK